MRELQVRNQRCGLAINTSLVRQIAVALLEKQLALSRYELAVFFVSSERMARVNWNYLSHEGSTDVISFNYREGYADGEPQFEGMDLAGEIYISAVDSVKQAAEFGTHWQEEIVRYLVHGVLHLRGYDDLQAEKRKVMKREENRLLKALATQFNLLNLGR